MCVICEGPPSNITLSSLGRNPSGLFCGMSELTSAEPVDIIICPCAESKFLQRPLCPNAARGGSIGSNSGCKILHLGVCNSLDHDLVTGTTVHTHSNVHTLSCLRLSFSPPLVSTCLLLIHICVSVPDPRTGVNRQ